VTLRTLALVIVTPAQSGNCSTNWRTMLCFKLWADICMAVIHSFFGRTAIKNHTLASVTRRRVRLHSRQHLAPPGALAAQARRQRLYHGLDNQRVCFYQIPPTGITFGVLFCANFARKYKLVAAMNCSHYDMRNTNSFFYHTDFTTKMSRHCNRVRDVTHTRPPLIGQFQQVQWSICSDETWLPVRACTRSRTPIRP
jgi:hypothetical protein